MTEGHGPGLSQHHVVILLVELLLDVGDALGVEGAGQRSHQGQHILFINGKPVFHPVTEVLKEHLCKPDKGVGAFPTAPSALLGQRLGQVKVEHGHQGLDAVF